MKSINSVEEVPSLYCVSLEERWSDISQVLDFLPRQSQGGCHCLQTSGLISVSLSHVQTYHRHSEQHLSYWNVTLLKEKNTAKNLSIRLSLLSLVGLGEGSNISVIANTHRCILIKYVKDKKAERRVFFSGVENGKYNKRMCHYKVWEHRMLDELCG